MGRGSVPGRPYRVLLSYQDSELLELWTECSLVNTAVSPAPWRGGIVGGSGQTEARDGYVSGNSGSGGAVIQDCLNSEPRLCA